MLHLLCQTLTPQVGLRSQVERWHEISIFLREPARRRKPQLELLAESLSPD